MDMVAICRDCLADHCISVVTDLAIRDEIIRAYRIAWIDLSLWDELVDVDRTSGFEGDVFQLFLPDLDVRIGVDLESLHDIFGLDFLAGVGIDLEIIDLSLIHI